MIRIGKVKIYAKEQYTDTIYCEHKTILNVVEKTSGDYSEILVNQESYTYTDETVSSTDTSSTYDVYANTTVEQAVEYYKKMKVSTITWLEPLTEVTTS